MHWGVGLEYCYLFYFIFEYLIVSFQPCALCKLSVSCSSVTMPPGILLVTRCLLFFTRMGISSTVTCEKKIHRSQCFCYSFFVLPGAIFNTGLSVRPAEEWGLSVKNFSPSLVTKVLFYLHVSDSYAHVSQVDIYCFSPR